MRQAQEKLSYKQSSYYGAGMLKIPLTEVGAIPHQPLDDQYALISVLHTSRIYPRSMDPTPQWWEDLVSQEEFVKQSGHTAILVRLPDDAYLLCGKHVESFVEWLYSIPSDGVLYDRFVGGFIIDNPQWTTDTNTMMSDSGILSTPKASEYISPVTEQTRKLLEDAAQAEQDGFSIPRRELFPTNRTLMEHQKPVVQVLAWRGKGILADDVGSGKSSMFVEGYFSRVQHMVDHQGWDFEDCWPLVIVTKKPLMEPIKRECELWFRDVKVVSITGGKTPEIPENTHVIICPLSSLDKQVEAILDTQPQGVIFDESHMIKNPLAKRTQAAITLAHWVQHNTQHPYIVCASATPMPNRPAELWSQLEITGMSKGVIEHIESRETFKPRIRTNLKQSWTAPVDDQKKFEIRYCAGKPGPFGWDASGSKNEHELSQVLRDNGLIRRKKSEFLTPLPLLYQNFLRCSISEEDMDEYNLAEQRFRDHLVISLRKKAKEERWSETQLRMEIEEKLYKASNAEALMKMTELIQLSAKIKLPHIVSWIHRFFAGDPAIIGKAKNRNKLIVFAHHKHTQQELLNHPELQQYGVLSVLAGTKNVNTIVDEFQDPNSGKNLIILYTEANTGLTLTAARDVLIVNLPFKPSEVIQMAGRCWARFSDLYAPHEAHLHYATSGTAIDTYLEEIIRKKGWLHKTIIDGEMAIDTMNSIASEEEELEDGTSTVLRKLAGIEGGAKQRTRRKPVRR